MLWSKQAAVGVLVLGLWGIGAAAEPAVPSPPAATAPTAASRPNFWDRDSLTGNWFGLGKVLDEQGISVRFIVTEVFQADVHGGLSTHRKQGRESGKYDLKVSFDLDKLLHLPGAAVHVFSREHWSDGINAASVGAASNVNANSGTYHHFYIKQLYYEQKLFDRKFTLMVGKVDLTTAFRHRDYPLTFDASRYAGDETTQFINRSLKHNPTIPFPAPGLGASVHVVPVDWWYIAAAVADADANISESAFHTAFRGPDDFFSIYETGLMPEIPSPAGLLRGTYRAGVWYDPRPKAYLDGSDTKRDDAGVYLSFDQMLWHESLAAKDDQGLAVFARWGMADKDVSRFEQFASVGTQYQGLIPTRDGDVLGMSLGRGWASPDASPHRNETVFETYYNIRVTGWLSISPDIQYICQPAGDADARDALVLGLRLRMTF
jgi:porin